MSFFKGFYTIFDLRGDYIGIAPHSDSSKMVGFRGNLPQEYLKRIIYQQTMSWVIAIFIFVIWILVVIFAFHPWLNERLSNKVYVVICWAVPTLLFLLAFIFFLIPGLNKALAPNEDIE